ncbi:MAG: ABC transporter ATP-binding protein [Halanaerobiales bacterium]
MNRKSVVEVINLKKKYPGVMALKGLDIDFPFGCISGIVGPNGSGKSTLLKIIAGLTQQTDGEVRIFGEKYNTKMKNEISFLPEINYFYDWMTVAEVINFSDRQFDNFVRDKAYEIVDFMNLKPEVKIEDLSKGMVGRVKLVLSMARDVPLIIMDEPLAGIDPKSRAQILESLIKEYNAKKQTIMLSTHEVFEAERFFDYVIFLEEGKVKLQGNADDLRKERSKSIQDLTKEVFD